MVLGRAGGFEGAGRSDDVEEVRQVRRGELGNGFEGGKEEFELQSLLGWKPVCGDGGEGGS